FDTTFGGSRDAFITKLNQSGSALVYSTFLGGVNDEEESSSIAIDSAGCAYVAGWTWSTDFPTTPGAYDRVKNGAHDAFVTKINTSGSSLLYSTFLGGSDLVGAPHPEGATSITIDSSGCVYAAGYTSSVDFPVTPGAFDTSLGGDWDAFLTKFNTSGNALLYSTYLGGDEISTMENPAHEYVSSISVDSAGGIYLAGWTYASDFPTTEDAFSRSFVGERDGFVAKLSIPENTLLYSTFMDGLAYSITLDSSGFVYVTGNSSYPDTEIEYGTIISNPLSGGASIIKFDMRSLKPDLLIKNGTELSYSGEGVFSTDGVNQTKSQTASPNQKVTYAFKMKNAGNVNDTYVITGLGGDSDWSVKYYDLATSVDITSEVVGSGWTTAVIEPRKTAGFYVKVSPDSTIPAGGFKELLIQSISLTDATKIDVVKAVTSFIGTYKTDMLIKTGVDISYRGFGTYNTDGTNQTKSQNVSAGQKVICAFRALNAGNAYDTFRITGTAGGNGWTVKYLDLTTGADVTSQVTGGGWLTGMIAPGIMKGVYAQIKPDTTVPLGSSITLTITGTSESDNTKIDVVKSVTTCVASYKPDLTIKNGSEAVYTGDGIFNTDGTNQTKSQSASAGLKAIYSFRIKNSGYISDSIRITGTAGGAGWSVKYYDLANVDITSQVTGSGWLSGTLASGTDKGFFVKVSPDSTVALGASKTLVITATSVGDGTKKDVVKAVTNVP
ncbi:MAG: SBBP repeat-containing protein, partial [Armatimonadota bacterium]